MSWEPGLPALPAVALLLAGIRKLTPRPVRYLVLSHWHWDLPPPRTGA